MKVITGYHVKSVITKESTCPVPLMRRIVHGVLLRVPRATPQGLTHGDLLTFFARAPWVVLPRGLADLISRVGKPVMNERKSDKR